jgi:hypothetical protein
MNLGLAQELAGLLGSDKLNEQLKQKGYDENIFTSTNTNSRCTTCRIHRGKLIKIEVKYIYESDYFIISPWKKGKLINIMETIPL